MAKGTVTRRGFLMGSALLTAVWTKRWAVARTISPNDRLNTAHVGVGGKGRGHLQHMLKHENVVALCDVDSRSAASSFEACPKVTKYRDWRVMFDKQNDIDAVIVATPDHMHAPIALAAMELGKHVYVEKPLTHTIREARRLTEAARKYKVATQMGNQGHSCDGVRQTCEMIWSGAIGAVREVHSASDRPIWPLGFTKPLDVQPVPPEVDWDLWLGVASVRPFGGYYTGRSDTPAGDSFGYMPYAWRGWWDFGGGALGDMGCHYLDCPYRALHLGAPSAVDVSHQEGATRLSGPLKSVVVYEFPERVRDGKVLAPVKLYWYDGKLPMPRPKGLPEGENAPVDGTMFVGDDGILTCDVYGQNPQLHPASRMKDCKMPDPVLERIPYENGDFPAAHRADWVRACKEGKQAGSHFDFAGPLTELVLLGNVAIRAGRRIEWDSQALKITNDASANALLGSEYRKGWEF